MKKRTLLILLFILSKFCATAQTQRQLFENSYVLLNKMITDQNSYCFKKAVFSVENAYLNNQLDTIFLDQKINNLKNLSTALVRERQLTYSERDAVIVNKRAAIFAVMCDTIPVDNNGKIYKHLPMHYDFNDVFGHKNRENLFVSKLLETNTGNCHSMPYLYKILAEEIGIDAHLALSPNHVYIKHQSVEDGWYNTELTSGIFPIDAWIMASGFVHIDAITNGVFMKALNNKESIALLLIDLAENYNVLFPENNGDFVLKCCESALIQYPNFATALILKAETKYNQLRKEKDAVKQDLLFKNLEKEYAYIHKIGYRNMPENIYLDWLISLKTEKSKYENKSLK
jgi:hypothetical protein